MLAMCTRCWAEMKSDEDRCSACGAQVDEDVRSYEEKLLAALVHPLAEARARICWVLGQQRDERAVPHLLRALNDADLFVRAAAIRALGEIGDPASFGILEEVAASENMVLRRAGKDALRRIGKRADRGHDPR